MAMEAKKAFAAKMASVPSLPSFSLEELKLLPEYKYAKEVFVLFGDKKQLHRRGIRATLEELKDIVTAKGLWEPVAFLACSDNALSRKVVSQYTTQFGELWTLTVQSISRELLKSLEEKVLTREFAVKGGPFKLTKSTPLEDFCSYVQRAHWYARYKRDEEEITPMIADIDMLQ